MEASRKEPGNGPVLFIAGHQPGLTKQPLGCSLKGVSWKVVRALCFGNQHCPLGSWFSAIDSSSQHCEGLDSQDGHLPGLDGDSGT